ncbi:MAG: TerB family tellurite resistance protein [Alteromonadaceae bacterium]|nr:TerB family tellurite resistance protein [Alteromonadaceae bacterium]
MFAKLTDFLQTLSQPAHEQNTKTISLEIACTVLLCEVMRADGKLAEEEQQQLIQLITNQFNLNIAEAQNIITQSIALSESATDFYQFTTKVNEHYTIEERMKIVELLWQLAYADGELASIETHIIRKIADLLHLRHSEYIQTKPKP